MTKAVAAFLAFMLTSLVAIAAEAPLRIGSTAGPYAQIMDYAAGLAAKQGLAVKVVEFNDYALPNEAMKNGDIDVSMFQTRPYLDNAVKSRGYDIVPMEPAIIVPMGIYSHKIKSLSELKEGDTLAIPNDPSNGARGLLLMQRAGLIELKAGVTTTASIADITANPKHFRIRELDAAQVPRSLDDMAAAAVNMSYALPAGLDPKSAMILEGTDTPFSLIWTAPSKSKDDPRI
ncbi:MAG: methionine ABC transporter substrate-binding protein, partial [Silvibacterium sp.]|nr:methionine ABC transporter substrate-binding protein [Silvibacterium sp.]